MPGEVREVGPMRRWRSWGVLAAVIAVAALALPGLAAGAGITLDRAPFPPQAIPPGVAEQISWTITYGTVAKQTNLSVTDPNGQVVAVQNTPYAFLLPGEGSPLSASFPLQTSAGSPSGRYTVSLQFISSIGVESTASTVFDVARDLGTMTLTKYEDLNGNGVRDPGEPGVANWPFNLVNPFGGTSTVGTGPDGTVTVGSVPAGQWTVGEPGRPGWAF